MLTSCLTLEGFEAVWGGEGEGGGEVSWSWVVASWAVALWAEWVNWSA